MKSRNLFAGLACLLLLLGLPISAHATTSTSVETYVDSVVVDPSGNYPNQPLSAGELKLQKTQPPVSPKPTVIAPRLPVGGLKAPQLQPPSASNPLAAGSSAGVMMMQGMRNALLKSGLNPNLPQSSIQPQTAATGVGGKADSSASSTAAPVVQPADANGMQYQPGQAPKNFVLGSSAAANDMVAKPDVAAVDVPKATDMNQQPVPLDQATAEVVASSASAQKSAASVFGAPVEDTQDAATTLATPSVPTNAAGKNCEASVKPWTKDCSEAGYPAGYVGKLTGETRVVCPSGESQEVWLTNSCAPPALSPTDRSATASSVDAATDHSTKVDGGCGPANGLATNGKPAADLCALGEPTEVSGEGPWRWSCKGWNGGMTISCAAPVAKGEVAVHKKAATETTVKLAPTEDGKCGTADGMGSDMAPISGLCSKGIPSRVNGGGPWTWACSGTNGGMAASCSAMKRVDGVCGVAGETGTDTMPQRDLCSAGYASAVTGNGPWQWTCSGLYGGIAATCSASAKINAVCGSASLGGHREAPTDALCSVGEAGKVSGAGPWHWVCSGGNSGASVSCTAAQSNDGACGRANGNPSDKAPSADLCLSGHASRVTGDGPWYWNCAGSEGGDTVGCTAPTLPKTEASTKNSTEQTAVAEKTVEKLVDASCGTATNVPSSRAPSDGLCATGSAGSVVTDTEHWVWHCAGTGGGAAVTCTAPQITMPAAPPMTDEAAVSTSSTNKEEPRCGASAGVAMTEAPRNGLCAAGKPTKVHGEGPWNWVCNGKAGHRVACAALVLANGSCGSASGSVLPSQPTTGLCDVGSPTPVSGNGPWVWSCVGTGGGSSASCSASSPNQQRLDGTCGVASTKTSSAMPNAGLCDTGVPSQVYGDGPWTWTCSGQNGGIASSCSANRNTLAAPPPPAPAADANCGAANGVAALNEPLEGLCSSGTATQISGTGPWNWNCLGTNGGMSVSCTAPLVPPPSVNGECGNANGISTLTAPRSGLCASGITSAVSGRGPWTWSCSGTNGGAAVSCVAPLAGGAGPLPSVVTPIYGDDAPVPKASPRSLVTPKLPTGPLPPLNSGSLPQLQPSGAKPSTEQNLGTLPVNPLTPPNWSDMVKPPEATPSLPSESQPINPPPVRDNLKPSQPVKPSAMNSEGQLVSGARLQLDPEISTLSFQHGSDQLDKDAAKNLDRLASVLLANGSARVTLIASADNSDSTPRDARRLSLARALTVRDYLTSKGVSSARLDVRALGANVQGGDLDRVDIKVN